MRRNTTYVNLHVFEWKCLCFALKLQFLSYITALIRNQVYEAFKIHLVVSFYTSWKGLSFQLNSETELNNKIQFSSVGTRNESRKNIKVTCFRNDVHRFLFSSGKCMLKSDMAIQNVDYVFQIMIWMNNFVERMLFLRVCIESVCITELSRSVT